MGWKDREKDRKKHHEETDWDTWTNRDHTYKEKGPSGREWKEHKYIFKKKSPAGYMRYYYEVPSEVEGRSNVVGYYEDAPENRRAMKYGGDSRREVSNKKLLEIENGKQKLEEALWYIEEIPKDIAELDIDGIDYNIRYASEHIKTFIKANSDELMANLTGITNDVKNFFGSLFK